MKEQWQELKETIIKLQDGTIEFRDGDSTGTQQDICKFLVDLMDVLETQGPCEDCVSRQAVLDALNNHTYSEEFCVEHHIDWSINLGTAHIVINDLPSVTPQPKTGKWIKYCIPRCGEQHYRCTSCGYYINFGQWGEVYTKQFKYCPNCGARMEAESEE